MSAGAAFLLGPGGQVSVLTGQRGTTPECPEALFKVGDVVKVRRLKHLRHLPELAAIAVVIPPGFSPDWALADWRGDPRPLMYQVGARCVTYLVGFDNNPTPYLLREGDLRPRGYSQKSNHRSK